MSEQGRHPDLSPLVDSFGPAPSAASRRALLRHVADCRDCRAALAAREPSAVFGVLALEAVPDDVLERLDRGLAARLDGIRSGGGRRRSTAWAGLAASFVLAAALGTYVVTRGPGAPGPAREITRESSMTTAAASLDAGTEVMTPVSAHVFDLTVGEVDLVMIFDEALRL